MQEIRLRVNDIIAKMFEFGANKRNNLIFYGIQAELRKPLTVLLNIRENLNIYRIYRTFC